MPFFFVVSGLLFKVIPIRETIKKGWIQLMRPYFLMCLISCVIMISIDLLNAEFSFKQCASLGIGLLSGNDSLHSHENWSSSLWFCYALFILKIVLSFLQTIRNKAFIWGGICLLATLTLVVLFKGNLFPFRIDSSLVGLFFFGIGFFMKESIKSLLQAKSLIRFSFLFFSLFCLIVCSCFNLDFKIRQGLSINVCYFGERPFLFLISGLSGSVAVLIIASFISFQSQKAKNIVMQISNGTIIILGFHWVIYKLLFGWWLMSYNVITAVGVALVNIYVCYFIILMASRYCPALLGNRELS